jgi:hypothetical protein
VEDGILRLTSGVEQLLDSRDQRALRFNVVALLVHVTAFFATLEADVVSS